MQLARGDRFHWTAPMYRMMAIQIAEKIKSEINSE